MSINVNLKFYFSKLITRYFISSDSNPIKIKLPPELAGKTLEWRLQNYDWTNHFHDFQEATRLGSYNPMCWKRGENIIPVSNIAFFTF